MLLLVRLVAAIKRVEIFIRDTVIVPDVIFDLLGHLYAVEDLVNEDGFLGFQAVEILLIEVEWTLWNQRHQTQQVRMSPLRRFLRRLCCFR